MDDERASSVKRLERSSHTAFIDASTLYVWGGHQVADGEEVVLPSGEILLCDLNSRTWERRDITGVIPPDLTAFCGSYCDGTFYIFAGCDTVGYTNQMYSVDLTKQCYSWKKLTDTKGTTPSPRNKHSCWVHRRRLIYFGGYGCKTVEEVRNTSSSSFIVEEMSWMTIEGTLFRCWGWNNEVNVFDTHTATWSMPETRGPAPCPRGCHAAAVLGNKGYISGGLETTDIDMYCLDLGTWTWTQFDFSSACRPLGRSMHTMTPISDHTLFIYGGLGTDGKTLNDAWQFDTLKKKWTKMRHPHTDKPRVCHTACLGSDGDAVVFGGIDNFCFLMDSGGCGSFMNQLLISAAQRVFEQDPEPQVAPSDCSLVYEYDFACDRMAVLRAPWQHHCSDMLLFQTQPYSLSRLCEDFIGRNAVLFGKQLEWLPSKMQTKIQKRALFFSIPTN